LVGLPQVRIKKAKLPDQSGAWKEFERITRLKEMKLHTTKSQVEKDNRLRLLLSGSFCHEGKCRCSQIARMKIDDTGTEPLRHRRSNSRSSVVEIERDGEAEG
jgi:hypothetical protein